jgi:hypothetical protein
MANNRELSQVAGFIIVDDSNRNIGIATTATPYVGIGTTNPQAKLQVVGDVILDQVKVTSSGIVTSSQPGITTVVYYGDGSNLIGVNAFNVINQDLTSSPVYPTFANNTGVTSVGISTNKIVFVPDPGNLGIGTTNPQSTLQVGSAITMYGPTGIVSAVAFYGDGSNLIGVNAFNVIPQDLTASPVYPTFANNTGVSSVGIASTGFVYIPSTGSVGINSVQPAYKLDVGGDINISGTYRVNGRSVLDDALIYSIVFG